MQQVQGCGDDGLRVLTQGVAGGFGSQGLLHQLAVGSFLRLRGRAELLVQFLTELVVLLVRDQGLSQLIVEEGVDQILQCQSLEQGFLRQ